MSCSVDRFCSSALYSSLSTQALGQESHSVTIDSSATSSSSQRLRSSICLRSLTVPHKEKDTVCCMSLDLGVSRTRRRSLFFMWGTSKTSFAELRSVRASWTAVHRRPSLHPRGLSRPLSARKMRLTARKRELGVRGLLHPLAPWEGQGTEHECWRSRGKASSKGDRKSTRLNSSHSSVSRMPSSA